MVELRPGAEVAGYRVERRLGSGASGTVYLAHHPRLPRQDALKVFDPSAARPILRDRFLREAQLAARLDHPHIVAVYDCGTSGELLWIAMRFVDGYDAARLIEQHPGGVPPQRALAITAQAAQGLDAAHRAGVIHRDVKPSNLLIEAGTGEHTLVSDFGIARTATEPFEPTGTASIIGTLAYTAPEQFRGEQAGPPADVYALGCTLFQLLTGSVPYPRELPAATVHAHLAAPPPRPSRLNRAIPAAMDAVIARALAKDPGQRYDSCGALAAAAATALESHPARPWHHRKSLLAGLFITVAALAFAAVTLVVHPGASSTSTASPASAPNPGWGSYAPIVAKFPRLLPPSPSASGFENLRCAATDVGQHTVPSNQPLGTDAVLTCTGDGHPVANLQVHCLADGTKPTAADNTNPGDSWTEQTWTRGTASGSLAWSTATMNGHPIGQLVIRFDDPPRASCVLAVIGGESGRALFDAWWPTAPI
ncbi:serine/threonine-protein kinase [Nocardia sp. NPDC059240]|uniref:serine/threonine-protein kinase n=1 Tax=Nocardia sp. NPDC059240 TaxID=3346786 RepID=UPI0036CAA9D1